MYSLEDLNRIFQCKSHLNIERFVHYFTHRFGYSERAAKDAYKIFRDFPIYDPQEREVLDIIIPMALQIVDDIQKAWDKKPQNLTFNYEKVLYKLIYKDSEIKEIIINLHEPNDVITYAGILQRDVEIIAFLKLVETFHHKGKDQHAFDGDYYDSFDDFWGSKSNVYLACAKEKCFKRLIYIKGKGYLLNGEPNIDPEGQYNAHALTLRKFVRLGNIYTDLEKLQA